MWIRVALVAACVASLGACKKVSEWADKRAKREAEQADAAPVVVRPTGPGLSPGEYRIVEVRVEATPTTRWGRTWDEPPGELPDLVIRIRIAGQEDGTCTVAENHAIGRCKLDLAFTLDATTRIELEVVDVDTLFDDPVGGAVLSDPSSWGVAMALPLQPSGRLRTATLVLARPLTWWELHRGQLVGLGAGIALALAVLGTFRRSLLPPPPVPPPIPMCTHCGAVLGADPSACTHCGAVQKGSVP